MPGDQLVIVEASLTSSKHCSLPNGFAVSELPGTHPDSPPALKRLAKLNQQVLLRHDPMIPAALLFHPLAGVFGAQLVQCIMTEAAVGSSLFQ